MATILSFSPNRAVDLNGFAVPGARALIYESGTSTPREVFSDPECTTPHPSPIMADGAGVFPPIYDAGGCDVKVAVTTPDGTMLAGYPMDPARLISTDSAGAAGIQFSPTEEIPVTNVQAAIERVQENMVKPLADYGLGVTGNAALIADIDATSIASGSYRYATGAAGTFPSGITAANGGMVRVWRETATSAVMILTARGTRRQYIRALNGATWGEWAFVMTSADTATDAVWAAGVSTAPVAASPAAIKAAIGGLALGGGQKWARYQSRIYDTMYRNETGRPIMVAVTGDAINTARPLQVSETGATNSWLTVGMFGEDGGIRMTVSTVVPAGWRYRILGTVNIEFWAELR